MNGYTVYSGRWTRQEVAENLAEVYIFGDNTEDRTSGYVPKMTQAVIRTLPNAVGLDTKHNRRKADSSYWNDSEFEQFKAEVYRVFSVTDKLARQGVTVYIPENLGNGRAELEQRAPRCYRYLVNTIKNRIQEVQK